MPPSQLIVVLQVQTWFVVCFKAIVNKKRGEKEERNERTIKCLKKLISLHVYVKKCIIRVFKGDLSSKNTYYHVYITPIPVGISVNMKNITTNPRFEH